MQSNYSDTVELEFCDLQNPVEIMINKLQLCKEFTEKYVTPWNISDYAIRPSLHHLKIEGNLNDEGRLCRP